MAAVLYTPAVLDLATQLAEFPWNDDLPLQGSARSRSCGSSISLGLSTSSEGRIARVGIKSQACAVGQAAAAIFASGASGRNAAQIGQTIHELERWLAGTGPVPSWPHFDAIEAAREYPGRHGAIMLAWLAAGEALPTG